MAEEDDPLAAPEANYRRLTTQMLLTLQVQLIAERYRLAGQWRRHPSDPRGLRELTMYDNRIACVKRIVAERRGFLRSVK